MLKEVSIIIPTYNEEHYLPKLLTSIARQQFTGKLQVIVVDGRSEDRTVAVAKTFSKRLNDLLIFTSKRGTSHQRNQGAKKAKYHYLLFLDADVILPDGFLNRIAQHVDPTQEILAHAIHLPTVPNLFDYLYFIYSYINAYIVQFFDPVIPGSFILTSRNMFRRVQGFDEHAILGEDSDYGQRAVKAGARYRLFIRNFTYVSPRRLRQMGRLKLLWFWAKYGIHSIRHKKDSDQNQFYYPFGKFGKEYV